MRNFFGLVVLVLGFTPVAQAQISDRVRDILRRIEERRVQIKICANNTQSEWAFEECLRGRPLAGVMEGNRALLGDVADAGRGDGYATDSIVRGSVWGRGSSRSREYYRPENEKMGPVKRASIGAGIGAAMGSSVTGEWRGAVGGAGAGALIGLVMDRRERSRMEKELRQEEVEARMREREEVGSQSSPVSMGEFELTNASPATIEVFDGEKFLFRMRPGETRKVTAPQEQYTARALVPNNRGGISRGDLETQSTNDGWTFEEPAVARR